MQVADMPPHYLSHPWAISAPHTNSPGSTIQIDSASRSESNLQPLSKASMPRPLNKVFGPLDVRHETTGLKSVIIGHPSPENYDPRQANPINRRSLHTLVSDNHVSLEQASFEFYKFREVLEEHGVSVASPPVRPFKDQMYTRDPCGVIGDTLVIARMATNERSPEVHALLDLILHLRENNIGNEDIINSGF